MRIKFKSGAASFYVVAFSTLILTIIAASFATAIVAEVTRAANDDLSQSAYDAALAGVEDAKLAFISYKNCIESGVTIDETYKPSGDGEITCKDIIYWMNHPDCDMVAHILGRLGPTESGEVLIEETVGSDNEMNQAYTCAMIEKNPVDYKGTLSSTKPQKTVRVSLADVEANRIKAMKISWFAKKDSLNFSNVVLEEKKVAFQSLEDAGVPVPATIAVRLLQTAKGFSLEDLNGTSYKEGSTWFTDRATVYLVPTDDEEMAKDSKDSYIGVYNGEENILTAEQVAVTNDKKKDLPYAVYCSGELTSEIVVCSATLRLPDVINRERSDDTFMFMVALPYVTDEQPEVDFKLEYYCEKTDPCGHDDLVLNEDGEYENNVAATDNIQVTVDSTGRANDLYRRIEVRLGPEDDADALSWYAVQAFGSNKNSVTINKVTGITTEWGL